MTPALPAASYLAGGLVMISILAMDEDGIDPVSYTHLRAHETVLDIVCRLLLEKKKNKKKKNITSVTHRDMNNVLYCDVHNHNRQT